jgi:hypothetical protein
MFFYLDILAQVKDVLFKGFTDNIMVKLREVGFKRRGCVAIGKAFLDWT